MMPERDWLSCASRFTGLFVCENCRAPTSISFEMKPGLLADGDCRAFLDREFEFTQNGHRFIAIRDHRKNTKRPWGRDLGPMTTIIDCYPSRVPVVPEGLPDKAHEFWAREAAAGMGPSMKVLFCRIVIEAVCKDKGATQGNLYSKIESLGPEGAAILAPDMVEWAHAIRNFGNDVAHEMSDFSDDESAEVYDFTTMLLEVLYSVPARVKRLRERATTQ